MNHRPTTVTAGSAADPVLDADIAVLELSLRTTNVLRVNQLHTVRDVTRVPARKLFALSRLGRSPRSRCACWSDTPSTASLDPAQHSESRPALTRVARVSSSARALARYNSAACSLSFVIRPDSHTIRNDTRTCFSNSITSTSTITITIH